MAVEARHLNLFPSQLIQDMVSPCKQGGNSGASVYNAPSQPMRFPGIPMGTTTLPVVNNSFYQPAVLVCDQSVQAKTSLNTDSGVTYNIPADSRKRCRESINPMYSFTAQQKNNSVTQFPSFVGDDILPQIQQHQLEIDTLISQHTKRIRLELEERQKQQARLLAAAMGEGVMKKLKERDEQIQRMGKINLVLQERVKSLFVENQLWRDLAQSNEATANSLRTNLEQVLLHVGGGEERVSAVEEDAESCCGSSDAAEAGQAQDKEGEGSSCYSERRCKRCGERESCVLLLPCRHLCLCNICGSGSHKLQTCPVCNSTMTATLHVNMS